MVDKARDHRIGYELDRRTPPASVEQHVMQVDAMDNDVGIFETGAERSGGRNSHQFIAVERIQHQERGRRIRNGHDLRHQTEAIENMKYVRPELNAIANGAEFGGAFEHARGPAASR